MISTIQSSRDWETQVYWLWGPTGSGKTRWVYETCDRTDLYVKDGTNKWFCGYTGQRNVLFDDFRPSQEIPFSRLLRLLDRYSMQVETKGGTVNFNPHRIFITSPKPPRDTWTHIDWIKDEDLNQLTRRITKVIEFSTAMRNMPFDLIDLAPPTVNDWSHSVPQTSTPQPILTAPVISPAPVVTAGQTPVSDLPQLDRPASKRMTIRSRRTPVRLTQEEILSDQDGDTEPSDAEGIDENESRSEDSGTEGSLCDFLNNGSVTESDYSSDEEVIQIQRAIYDSHKRKRGTGTTTTTVGSPQVPTLTNGRSLRNIILDSDSSDSD